MLKKFLGILFLVYSFNVFALSAPDTTMENSIELHIEEVNHKVIVLFLGGISFFLSAVGISLYMDDRQRKREKIEKEQQKEEEENKKKLLSLLERIRVYRLYLLTNEVLNKWEKLKQLELLNIEVKRELNNKFRFSKYMLLLGKMDNIQLFAEDLDTERKIKKQNEGSVRKSPEVQPEDNSNLLLGLLVANTLLHSDSNESFDLKNNDSNLKNHHNSNFDSGSSLTNWGNYESSSISSSSCDSGSSSSSCGE